MECSVTEVFIFLWVKRGNKNTNKTMYQKDLRATESCASRMMKVIVGLGQKKGKSAVKDFSF